jgi:ATP-dependent Clp protease ATP-binding subunit ClpC
MRGPVVLGIFLEEGGNMPAKMYRFTPNARQVMASAHEKAEQFRHSQIETGHLLLGFFLATNSTARRILVDLGLDGSQVEQHLKQILGSHERAPNSLLTLSTTVKKTLELAVEEAHLLGEDHIGTEHLLLGLLRQEDDSVREILARLGVSPEDIRTHAQKVRAWSRLYWADSAPRSGSTVGYRQTTCSKPSAPACRHGTPADCAV